MSFYLPAETAALLACIFCAVSALILMLAVKSLRRIADDLLLKAHFAKDRGIEFDEDIVLAYGTALGDDLEDHRAFGRLAVDLAADVLATGIEDGPSGADLVPERSAWGGEDAG